MQLKTRGERTLRKLLPYLSVSCHYTIVLLYSYQLSQSKTTVTVLVSYLSIVLVGLSMEQTSSTFPLLEPAAILYVISRKVFSSANLVYQSRQTQSRNKTIIEFDSGFKNDLAGIILNPKGPAVLPDCNCQFVLALRIFFFLLTVESVCRTLCLV